MPQQGDKPSLDLPAVNAYQRLLQYQELRRLGIAPGFYVEVRLGQTHACGATCLPLCTGAVPAGAQAMDGQLHCWCIAQLAVRCIPPSRPPVGPP